VDLLAEPERITQDPVLAFSTAMYFWMSPRGNKVSLLLLAVVLASDLALLLATSQGKYFVGNRLTAPVGGARPREDQERLWEILEGMCRDL